MRAKSKLVVAIQHWAGRAVIGATALGLVYVFASSAIDSGSLLDYAITLLLIVVAFQELLGAWRGYKGRSAHGH